MPSLSTDITVPTESSGSRLDIFLLSVAPKGVTRGLIQKAIKEGKIAVNEKKTTKPGNTIHFGQTIRVDEDAFAIAPPPVVEANVEIPLEVIHEEPELLVINKQAGLPVHAGMKNEHPTLCDALLARYSDLKEIGDDPLRPGIVHRLDKDTSGVMLVARTPKMYEFLKEQFQLHHVHKTYTALVLGVMGEPDGKINQPIMRSTRNPMRRTVADKGEGRPATTLFLRTEKFSHYTLLEVKPITGRTHQIRVHLSHIGFPILGDNLYGKQMHDRNITPIRRQFLHASKISFTREDGTIKTFSAPLPADLQQILDELRAKKAAQRERDKLVTHKSYRVSKH